MRTSEQTADAQLVRLSMGGDHAAFEEIVRRNVSSVSAVAYALTGDRCTSEDVTQEVFLKAWQRLKDLREPERLRAWLCVIAQNVANSLGRKTAHDPLRSAADLETATEIESDAPSPVEAAVDAEHERLVWSSIEQIPEIYRVPLVLFYRHGQSVAQVATALELSDDAVRQRLSRARTMLKDEVAKVVESSITASRPGSVLVATIMMGLASATAQATAATVTTAVVTKMAGSSLAAVSITPAALVGSIVGPLQFIGGFYRAYTKYRTGQSPEERRLILGYLLQVPSAMVVFSIIHILLIKESANGTISNAQCIAGMLLEAVALIAALVFIQRRYKINYYALLKGKEATLTQAQLQQLHLMEAAPRERELGRYLEAIDGFRRRPFSSSYAVHGGLVFGGMAWVLVDGIWRGDTALFLSLLMAITVVELTAVACTVRWPERYLIHRAGMFLSIIPLLGAVVAYWQLKGITNPLHTTPQDRWIVAGLLPVLLGFGYLISALYYLAKHGRLIGQLRQVDRIKV